MKCDQLLQNPSIRTCLFSSMEFHLPIGTRNLSISSLQFLAQSLTGFGRKTHTIKCCSSSASTAIESKSPCIVSKSQLLNVTDDLTKDTVEQLLTSEGRCSAASVMMKMERKNPASGFPHFREGDRWFPYLDRYRAGNVSLSSEQVLEALDTHLLDSRRERLRRVVEGRSYSICLVVEGLSDLGNVSAAFRSADALGIQSVHVVSCDISKRYKENRHVSMGAEKWLDIELWDSTPECFDNLRSRGYRIATTHVGSDVVSIYDMNWSSPTAIIVGNEGRGISKEALGLSDLHCSIPMRGMVDSLNVSVAAGILMHHAVCDRILRLGSHGDLTQEERQILLAEFSLRHSNAASSIALEYAKRKRTVA
ncbi:hypothetical protein Dimus_038563 [Dionaea muscipula]